MIITLGLLLTSFTQAFTYDPWMQYIECAPGYEPVVKSTTEPPEEHVSGDAATGMSTTEVCSCLQCAKLCDNNSLCTSYGCSRPDNGPPECNLNMADSTSGTSPDVCPGNLCCVKRQPGSVYKTTKQQIECRDGVKLAGLTIDVVSNYTKWECRRDCLDNCECDFWHWRPMPEDAGECELFAYLNSKDFSADREYSYGTKECFFHHEIDRCESGYKKVLGHPYSDHDCDTNRLRCHINHNLTPRECAALCTGNCDAYTQEFDNGRCVTMDANFRNGFVAEENGFGTAGFYCKKNLFQIEQETTTDVVKTRLLPLGCEISKNCIMNKFDAEGTCRVHFFQDVKVSIPNNFLIHSRCGTLNLGYYEYGRFKFLRLPNSLPPSIKSGEVIHYEVGDQCRTLVDAQWKLCFTLDG